LCSKRLSAVASDNPRTFSISYYCTVYAWLWLVPSNSPSVNQTIINSLQSPLHYHTLPSAREMGLLVELQKATQPLAAYSGWKWYF